MPLGGDRFFIADPIQKIEHRSDPILIFIGEDTISFPVDTKPQTMKKALVDLVKKENEDFKNKPDKLPWEEYQPPRDPEVEATDALNRYTPPQSIFGILSGTALIMVIPPLAILFLAFVIRWIGRGFSPKAT